MQWSIEIVAIGVVSLHIKASQRRSSSSLSSDSVGSIIKQPATGNDIVGAWKPVRTISVILATFKFYRNNTSLCLSVCLSVCLSIGVHVTGCVRCVWNTTVYTHDNEVRQWQKSLKMIIILLLGLWLPYSQRQLNRLFNVIVALMYKPVYSYVNVNGVINFWILFLNLDLANILVKLDMATMF